MQMDEEADEATNEPLFCDEWYDVGQNEVHVNDQSTHEGSNVIPDFWQLEFAAESTGIETAKSSGDEIAQQDPLDIENFDVASDPNGNTDTDGGWAKFLEFGIGDEEKDFDQHESIQFDCSEEKLNLLMKRTSLDVSNESDFPN